MTYTQEKFVEQLSIGSKWAQKVADYLNSKGVICEATPMRVAKNAEEIKEFTRTDKDITFKHIPGNLEVKSRNMAFPSSPKMFPHDTCFVDTVSGWEQKEEKPFATVTISQLNGNMVVFPADTYDTWEQITRFDKYRGYSDTFYIIKKEYIKSIDWLVDLLLAQQDPYL